MKQVVVIGVLSSIFTLLISSVATIGVANGFLSDAGIITPAKSNGLLSPVVGKSLYLGHKGIRWDMSQEQVRKCFPNEEFQFHIENRTMWFSDKIAGENVDIVFDFFDEKLHEIQIRIKPGAIIPQGYIHKFFKFENLLNQRYGKPVQKIRKGSSDPYTSDACAIYMGIGMYSSVWHSPESTISLILRGSQYKLYLWIELVKENV